MANPENLIPNEQRTPTERRENARKAGKASGESRRRRKAMREAFDELLSREFTDKEGNTTDGVTALVTRVYQKALKGDMRAVQFIRDTVGEMPVQRVEVDTIDPQARAEMDELLGLGD